MVDCILKLVPDPPISFLQPHQRQVTRILQFAAQAAHPLVPGEMIEPILKTLANNFITERNSSDVMAIGLNAVREVCSRCPLAMSEDLLRDLVMYKAYKEKSVMMAARSLISLYREQIPDLLHKRDRGRQTEAQAELPQRGYGEVQTVDHIPGSEALLKKAKEIDVKGKGKRARNDDSDDDEDDESDEEDDDESEDGWVDVKHDGDATGVEVDEDDDEEDDEDDDDEEDEDDEEGDDDDEEEEGDDDEEEAEDADASMKSVADTELSNVQVMDEKTAAQELALTRIFTDDDFKRIDAANIRKHTTNSRKRPVEAEKSEYVRLDDIEMIFKKRKTDKLARLESVLKGRTGRDKFGYKDGRHSIHCSKTNAEKRKQKNFGMMRHKARSKVKRSFKDKQMDLRKHLLKQKKMK